MVINNLAGRFLKIVKCNYDEEPLEKMAEIISEIARFKNYIGFRLDIYGESGDLVIIIIDKRNDNVYIMRFNNERLYDLAEYGISNVNELIYNLSNKFCYIEVFGLMTEEEINLILSIIADRAAKDTIRKPYLQLKLKQLQSIINEDIIHKANSQDHIEGSNTSKGVKKVQAKTKLLSKLTLNIDTDYSKRLASPATIAKILAFSNNYNVIHMMGNDISIDKCSELIHEFIESDNVWAISIRFNNNEIWFAKENKNSEKVGLVVRHDNNVYTDIESITELCDKIEEYMKKSEKVTITLYRI